jgi:phospholipid/cholesterol/gamma-HCH transport system ATP-binding protein
VTGSRHACRTILAADDLAAGGQAGVAVLHVTLELPAGGFALVHSGDRRLTAAVVDGLLGFTASGRARASFLERRWGDLDPAQALALRRLVRRVPGRAGWLDDRSVLENIMLAERHNTVVDERVLLEQASAMARRFGLPGLPTGRPESCTTADLEAAACVRAFLGRPQLVVLEHPTDNPDTPLLGPIIGAAQQVRRRGGAVIWFTRHPSIHADPSLPVSQRLSLSGGRLVGRSASPEPGPLGGAVT